MDSERATSSKKLAGKHALVTGASRGIGRAISLKLATEGAAVTVNFRSRAEEGAAVVSAVIDAGGRAEAVRADVSRLDDIRALFTAAEAVFGPIDVVVANAGLPFIGKPIVDVAEDEFDRLNAVNNKGVFFVLSEAARRVRDGGRIIDISTSTTVHTAAGMGLHAASKAGSRIIVEVLALELGGRGITVNSVLPGPTQTEFLKDAPSHERERIAHGSPMGRLGQPDDIAEVVAFLAGPGGRWITGQHLLANGGARV